MALDQVENKVGSIPEFTPNSSEQPGQKEADLKPEENLPQETVTPEPSDEKPAEEPLAPSVDTTVPSQIVDNQNQDLVKSVQGLQEERVKLLKEISELKGQRREIKQDQLLKVEQQIDELKDLHPDDVTIIDRVLRSKGFISKEEASRMFYDNVKQEELDKFLEKYPEYKVENDPSNANWGSLEREIHYYKAPLNPRDWREILERAHRSIVKVPSVSRVIQTDETKKRQIETASVGGGGRTPTAPTQTKTLSPEQKYMLRQGGFDEEDIKKMEARLGQGD